MKWAAGIATVLMLGLLTIAHLPKTEPGAVAKITESGKKRYVMYYRAPKGMFSMGVHANKKSLETAAKFMGAKVIKKHKGFFVVEGKDLDKQLKAKIQSFGDSQGLVIEEDYVYNTQTSCFRPPVTSPTPCDATGDSPQTVPWGFSKISSASARGITKADQIIVCVVDTGSDKCHPDLKGSLDGGMSFVDGNTDWQDDNGHGTHVAGTISAGDNTIDTAGITNAKIYTVKVLDSNGSGFGSWIAAGIDACVESGAKVINMSLGSDSPSGVIESAVNRAMNAGVKVIAAAGNSGGSVGYPAAFPGVIAISASDQGDRLASFSSRGPEVDWMAPGVDIESLQLGGGLTTMSGTSMASPHAAAVMAMALAVGRSAMRGNNVGLPIEHQGKGRINALSTVGP